MNFVAKASRLSVAGSAGRGRRRCQPLTSTLIYYQQSFSSSAAPSLNPKDSASRDKRMAGRLRFYKTVDVEPVPAPWEASVSTSDSKKESIDSPISAGVDDSQSATGIQHSTPETKHNIQKMLLPKQPGTNAAGDENSTSWYGITLDGRLLKSPMNQTLAVPSQNLAYAIAAEWDAQAKYLQPAQMPLMTLSCTALDQAAEFPEGYREQSLNYLPTDTVSTNQSIKHQFWELYRLISLKKIIFKNSTKPALINSSMKNFCRLAFGRILWKIGYFIDDKSRLGRSFMTSPNNV